MLCRCVETAKPPASQSYIDFLMNVRGKFLWNDVPLQKAPPLPFQDLSRAPWLIGESKSCWGLPSTAPSAGRRWFFLQLGALRQRWDVGESVPSSPFVSGQLGEAVHFEATSEPDACGVDPLMAWLRWPMSLEFATTQGLVRAVDFLASNHSNFAASRWRMKGSMRWLKGCLSSICFSMARDSFACFLQWGLLRFTAPRLTVPLLAMLQVRICLVDNAAQREGLRQRLDNLVRACNIVRTCKDHAWEIFNGPLASKNLWGRRWRNGIGCADPWPQQCMDLHVDVEIGRRGEGQPPLLGTSHPRSPAMHLPVTP